MAKMLIENMTKPFVPENFRDEYQARLRDAIMKKFRGRKLLLPIPAAGQCDRPDGGPAEKSGDVQRERPEKDGYRVMDLFEEKESAPC